MEVESPDKRRQEQDLSASQKSTGTLLLSRSGFRARFWGLGV